jgi:tetratricopeptide (TPR) repeat protein
MLAKRVKTGGLNRKFAERDLNHVNRIPPAALSAPTGHVGASRPGARPDMRLCITLTTVCLLFAAPAFAASQKDHDDCNSDDAASVIAGCTRVIGDTDEEADVRATAHIRRGLALMQRGKLDEAMSDYNTGIELDPNDALAYNNRAILWREKRDLDKAIADLTKAISIDPMPNADGSGGGPINLYFNRGVMFDEKQEHERAVADYDQAIKLDPGDPQAFYRRARKHFLLRNFDQSLADMKEAARLDPKDRDIASDLKDLEDGLRAAKAKEKRSR